MPGTNPKYFYVFSHLLLPTTLGGGSYHIHFTDKETGTSHMAGMWQSHDLNPESAVLNLCSFLLCHSWIVTEEQEEKFLPFQ